MKIKQSWQVTQLRLGWFPPAKQYWRKSCKFLSVIPRTFRDEALWGANNVEPVKMAYHNTKTLAFQAYGGMLVQQANKETLPLTKEHIEQVKTGIKYSLAALQMSHTIRDEHGKINAQLNLSYILGVAYKLLGKYQIALGYWAQRIERLSSTKVVYERTLFERASTHMAMGEAFLALRDTDKALHHFEQALVVCVVSEVTTKPLKVFWSGYNW